MQLRHNAIKTLTRNNCIGEARSSQNTHQNRLGKEVVVTCGTSCFRSSAKILSKTRDFDRQPLPRVERTDFSLWSMCCIPAESGIMARNLPDEGKE
jgi:hypothetical protein